MKNDENIVSDENKKTIDNVDTFENKNIVLLYDIIYLKDKW